MKKIDIFADTPYLTADNCEQVISGINYGMTVDPYIFFKDLQKCVEFFKAQYNGIITGFWLITVPSVDGGIQVITRVKSELPVENRLELYAAISDLVKDEMAYRITDNDISDLNSIPISEWIEDNKIYTIYDAYRGKAV